jgi:hypothetical protein
MVKYLSSFFPDISLSATSSIDSALQQEKTQLGTLRKILGGGGGGGGGWGTI